MRSDILRGVPPTDSLTPAPDTHARSPRRVVVMLPRHCALLRYRRDMLHVARRVYAMLRPEYGAMVILRVLRDV